ncbi:MAG: serine/threonine protein kinase [Gemmatimonadetes bacterium]|nr:serine/threonine protein kinase [Gemmatimonadota bacterium]
MQPDDPTTALLLRAVAGEFRLVREIGRGGMGVVYHAIDERLERAVAIKTLPPHLAADAAVRQRFLREARTAGALSHPNIVHIHSAAERDGAVYFVMALIEGESLAERLAREGRMAVADLLPIVRQLASALDYAHGLGVVHRDVKAENVLLDAHGRALVTDFGIARVTEAQPLTATGTVLGTVHYMSPEQVAGEPLDGRSDLYAMGVLMFLALTGRFPFERTTASAVLVAHVNATPPRVRDYAPEVSSHLDDLVAKLLAKRADDRLASARDLLAALNFVSATPAHIAQHAPVTVPVSPRLSADDAGAVWARAAELQANTGVQVPPPRFAPPAELLTQGYAASDVREAAASAGIPARYVDRALHERAVQLAVEVRPGVSLAKVNPILGSPTKLEFESVVEREVTPEVFEDIADMVRSTLGQMVTVSAVGRTLTINTVVAGSGQGGIPRYLQITVASRNGRTQVRAFEDLGQLAGGLFGGVGLGGGVGVGAIVGALLSQGTRNGWLVLAGLLPVAAAAYSLARVWFGSSARKKREELEGLVRRIAERVADGA